MSYFEDIKNNNPAIPEMLAATRKNISFTDVLMECAGDKSLVAEFDRLAETNLSQKGTALDLEIDKATGRLDSDLEKFVLFCWDSVFIRM